MVAREPITYAPRRTDMNKALSLALLVGGVVLIIYGISASDSFSSDVSRFFTGSPTDKTMWLLIGGIVAAAIGAGGMLRGTKSA
jgi:hypothetical protein